MTPSTRRDFLAATAAAAVPSRERAAEPARLRWSVIGFDTAADTVAEIGWDGIECPVRPKGQIKHGRVAEAFYGWASLHLPELFPTRVRATGQGLAYNTDRIFAAIGALQMDALMQHFEGSYARTGRSSRWFMRWGSCSSGSRPRRKVIPCSNDTVFTNETY